MPLRKVVVQYYRRPRGKLRASVCAGCGKLFMGSGIPFCSVCQNALPYTHFWEFDCDAALANLALIVHLEHVFPLCFYSHGSLIPRLIHAFKYQGQWGLAVALGEMLGTRLRDSPLARDLDAIIPVPLHWRKTIIRSYNQSDFISRGIARQTGLPVHNALRRHRFTKTQTLVGSHYERQSNVRDAISLRLGVSFPRGAHVLLVDDMITTGSTLMACADSLLAAFDVRISVASVGIATSLITGDRYAEIPSPAGVHAL